MNQATPKATQADYDALKAQVAALEAQLQTAKQQALQAIRFGVSTKGAVSIYGINGKFPDTKYASQWLRILDHGDKLRAFITTNEKYLSTKDSPKNYTDAELDKINGTNRVERAAAKAAPATPANGSNGSSVAKPADILASFTPVEIETLAKRDDLSEQEQLIVNTYRLRQKLAKS